MKKMIYEVFYRIRENGRTVGLARKWFDTEDEAVKFSDEVGGLITAYSKKS